MSERLVNTRVGQLKVSVKGEGERPTALLWHSLFVDERTWGRVLPDLVQDRRLVLVTGPGHGVSGDPGRRYTMDDCAEAALEVLDTLGIDSPVDWVGNAWGGHVGITFAARHPDRVRTLVAAGTPIQPYGLADRLSTSLLLAVYRMVGPIAYLTNAVADALLTPASAAPAASIRPPNSTRGKDFAHRATSGRSCASGTGGPTGYPRAQCGRAGVQSRPLLVSSTPSGHAASWGLTGRSRLGAW